MKSDIGLLVYVDIEIWIIDSVEREVKVNKIIKYKYKYYVIVIITELLIL